MKIFSSIDSLSLSTLHNDYPMNHCSGSCYISRGNFNRTKMCGDRADVVYGGYGGAHYVGLIN